MSILKHYRTKHGDCGLSIVENDFKSLIEEQKLIEACTCCGFRYATEK